MKNSHPPQPHELEPALISSSPCQQLHSQDHPVIGSDRICSVVLEIDCTPLSTCAGTADMNAGYVWRHCKYSATSIFVIKVFYLPTDAQENCFKKNIKIYIKTAPTCFGSITIIRERII